MAQRYDAVIIGGGHNGLVSAAYLARAGMKTLVLEQRHVLGGAAVTEEIFPGFRFSVFSYVVSLLRPEIIRELQLPRHGLDILPLDGTFTPLRGRGPGGGGDYLWRVNDHGRTIRELRRWSKSDAEAYEEYGQLMVEMARFIKPILAITPPDLTVPRPPTAHPPRQPRADLPAAPRAPAGGLRPADDDVAPPTSSTSGSRRIRSRRRCRRPGSSGRTRASARPARPMSSSTTTWARSTARSAPGASRRAGRAACRTRSRRRARALGAEIRTEAPVARIIVKNGRATGVALEDGEEIEATDVLSSVDSRRTFLGLVEPGTLDPEFEEEVRRFKFRGSSGKVNLAVDRLPDFTCLPGVGEHLRGAISFSPSLDDMERAYDDAKYGHFSKKPYIDMIIPTLVDPSMAPPGKHVISCFVQYAPYKLAPELGTWDDQREAFGDAVIDRIAEFAPNIRDIILHRNVQTPLDIERTTGLSEGNIFQGELSLEQLFFNRPVPGYARFRTPIRDLWLCGSATHPGGGIMGANGRIAAMEVLRARGRKAA